MRDVHSPQMPNTSNFDVDDAIRRGDLASIPKTMTLEQAREHWALAQSRFLLRCVRGGLTGSEISQAMGLSQASCDGDS